MAAVIRVFDSSFLSIERVYDEFGKILSGNIDTQFLIDYLPKLRVFKPFFPDAAEEQRVIEWMVHTRSMLPLAFQYHETTHSKRNRPCAENQ